MTKRFAAAFVLAAATALAGSARAQEPAPAPADAIDIPAFALGDEQQCGRSGDKLVVTVTDKAIAEMGDGTYLAVLEFPMDCFLALNDPANAGAKYLALDFNGPAAANTGLPVLVRGKTSAALNITAVDNNQRVRVIAAHLTEDEKNKIEKGGGFAFNLKPE